MAKEKKAKKVAKSQYGHVMSKQSGYIDAHLNKTPKEIVKGWNRTHLADAKMKAGRIRGHLRHLVESHKFNKATADKLLKS